MTDFNARAKLELWLESQSDEVRLVFASRTALRAIPIFSKLCNSEEPLSLKEDVILSSFWANAFSLSAGNWPSGANNLRAATMATANAANAASAAPHKNARASANVVAAANAATRSAAYAAARATNAASSGIGAYKQCSYDMAFISSGGSAQDLSNKPLWYQEKIPTGIRINWEHTKSFLEGLDGNGWEVWTSWYADRLAGKPLIKGIELGRLEYNEYGRVTFPPDDYKSAVVVNAKIKNIVDDYWAIQKSLAQNPTVESFVVNDDRLETRTNEIGLSLTDTEHQRNWYQALRESVEEALEVGENVLGSASKSLYRLYEALPESMADARVPKIWPRANKLRRLLERYDRALEGEHFDFEQIGADTADFVRGIVENYNNLRIGDASLNAADERAANPQEIEEILSEIAHVKPLFDDIIAEGLSDSEASVLLSGVLKNDVLLQNRIMGRLELIQNRDVIRNAVRSLLVWVRDNPVKGVTGSAASIVLAEKVVEYAAKIITYAETALPGMSKFIIDIIKVIAA